MLKRKKLLLLILCFVIVGGGLFLNRREIYINKVLSQEAYSYLPKAAKEYIRQVYKETGEVVLTEKNKQNNKLYLNPQYVDYLTYSDSEKDNLGEIPVAMIIDYSKRKEALAIDVPSSYDLRNVDGKNFVTPVRDQGNLGLCWSFATAGIAESHLLKTENLSFTESSKLISERQIDYVTSRNGLIDYKSEYVSFINRSLGDGGNFYISTIALANGVSLVDYNAFKGYDDTDLNKMELSDVISYNNSLYEVNQTINVPRLGLRDSTSILSLEEKETRNSYLKEIKKNIIENGAAYVGTYMDSSCQYKDANLNNKVIDVYNCNVSGGHAMQIIGWDDDIEYSYCADTKSHNSNISNCNRVVSGKGVWILKNSWGDQLQYPYLTYDSLYSSISFIDEIQSSENKDWDNNYILGSESENAKMKTYTLSDTKIRNDETIKKVKFIAEAPDTTYNVKITKKDGTYETFTKKTNLPGLITVKISDDIVVNKDTQISIYSDNGFIDKLSIFTSNIDTKAYIDLDKYDNMSISEEKIRLYSETKNINSGSSITYKVYDENNQDVSDNVTFTNNIVAENNINTLANFSNNLDSGSYRIDAIYNSEVIKSITIKFEKMAGLGTKDNPYIITNSSQLYQIRNDLDAYYELGNDIDLTKDTQEGGKLSFASTTCPQGFGWEAINGFSGSLDGKGHTIKGLYQNNYITCNEGNTKEWTNNGNGLFGSAYGNVTIKNLVLEDFDVNCQGGYCSALLSSYNANNGDYNDQNEYNATFYNIAIKNSKVSGIYNGNNSNSSLRYSYGGGLFSYMLSNYGNISISNIYLDINMTPKNLARNAYLASNLQGNNVNIQNIQLLGDLTGKYTDGSGDSILIHELHASNPVTLKNVISTTTAKNVSGNLLGSVWGDNLTIDGINILNISNLPLCRNNASACAGATNLNIYDKDTQLSELTNKENYSTWGDFDSNWVIKTIDGIPRIPVLKFLDFEYTSISDIFLSQKLNEHKSIYDYVTPNIEAAKRISYKSNDETIVKIDENGTIIPQSTGNTTIHVESLYDGYIKDVPISVTYVPHYTINFDANGATGTMDSIEVETGKNFKLPKNEFIKDYYELKEWNTKADGTGTSYSDLAEISAMNDKESITLYAIWWGEERIVTFDANGGTVSPDRKTVRIGQNYGDLPIPIKEGFGFDGWHNLKGGLYVDAFAKLSGFELTASWVEDAYTIIYDANGGTIQSDYTNEYNVYLISDALATTNAKNNKEKELYKNIYEKTGYKFKEWNTKADGTGISYSENQTIKLSNVDDDTLRLYAIWEKQAYSVTFDANEGTFADNKATLVIENWEDSKLDSIEKPTREGYAFKGFFTEKTGGTSLENYIATSGINQDGLVFYAQWEKEKYTLKFNANGATGAMEDQIFIYDTSQKLIKNTYVKEGYKFKEWNTKADGTGSAYSDEEIVKLTENITLYAIWEETYDYVINKYSVDQTNNYISKIIVNTTVDDFKNNIELNAGYNIEVDYKIINNKNVLFTGGKTKIYKEKLPYAEFTNVIIGDINGDGAINSADLLKIRQHLLGTKVLNGAYFLSSDINYDDTINSADLLRIRQHLLGTKPIE